MQQQFAGIHQQEAAVSPMQSAGFDKRKVRYQSAVLLDSFDTSDQISLRRVVKQNNRRAAVFFVFNDNIDFQLRKFVIIRFIHPAQQSRQRIAVFSGSGLFLCRQKVVQIINDMLLDVFQKVDSAFVAFMLMAQLVNRVFDRSFNKFLAQLLAFFTLLIFPVR